LVAGRTKSITSSSPSLLARLPLPRLLLLLKNGKS
jgi:hypothetical protein